MNSMRNLACVSVVAAGLSASSCTLVSVQSTDSPAGVRADGLVDGHAVLGWRNERQALRLDLFDGTSSGAVFELVLWKLARIELGLAGFGVGVGPVDVALGALWYDPHMPVGSAQRSRKPSSTPAQSGGSSDAAGAMSGADSSSGATVPGPCEQPGCAGHAQPATPAPTGG